MRNVFLLYMPPGNAEAMVHYEETIKQKVPIQRLSGFIPSTLRDRLISIFGASPIAVWGSTAGPRNRSSFERMSEGDDILIIEGNSVRLIGKIAGKVGSAPLSRELWKPLQGQRDTTWELIYFIANPRELSVPFKEFCRLFGFAENFQLRGFSTVAAERLEQFYQQYDDLYSVLLRIQNGQPVVEKAVRPAEQHVPTSEQQLVDLEPEIIDEVLPAALVSDHVKMQWKLACLGLKAGERVWVPVADQARLRKTFEFDSIDPEFSAGIDLPHSYVENIDVVWKQEFRIGAAYEIENSTSIYSGLLRFADLNILAPNTLYPMFVVAPSGRKNRVREQLRRPTFKQLELDKKVRFLSYETIDEIDSFFARATAGLNVSVILARSESVT